MKRFMANKKVRLALYAAAAVAIAWVALQFISPLGSVPGQNPFLARPSARPLVIAHAGGKGLNPENTLEAFAASVALGSDMIEMDVRLTKDGRLVTCHGTNVNRTSNGSNSVSELTLAELKVLNFGCRFTNSAGFQPFLERPAHIAALEELFQSYSNLPMTIEIKDRGEVGRRAAGILSALLVKYQMTPRVVVACFDDATLNAFRHVAGPSVATSSARGETRTFVLMERLRLDRLWLGGAVVAQVPADPRDASGWILARSHLIRAAHARNMAVHFWTVNEPEEMHRLIGMGADGLITDYPDRLKALLGQPERIEGIGRRTAHVNADDNRRAICN